MKPKFILMASGRQQERVAQLAKLGVFGEVAKVNRRPCPDGETLLRLDLDQIDGRDVVLFGETSTPDAAFEFYSLACAAQQYGARSLYLVVSDAELVVPGSKAEKPLRNEELMRLRMLLSIPQTPFGNRIFLNRPGLDVLDYFFVNFNESVEVNDGDLLTAMGNLFGKEQNVLRIDIDWDDLISQVIGLPKEFDLDDSQESPVVLSTRSYRYLADEVCELTGLAQVEPKISKFKDAEVVELYSGDISGLDVIVIGGTPSATDLFELYRICNAVVDAGARSLRIVCPYFGWQAMERSDEQGNEVVTAKSAARLLSSIPRACLGNSIMMFDLHAAGIPHYFEGAIRREHIYLKPLTLAAIIDAVEEKEFRLSSVDVGRFGWVVSLAGDITEIGDRVARPAGVFKIRLSATEVSPVAHAGDVDGFVTVVFDDFTRTGGSIDRGSVLLDESGARDIIVVLSHGIRAENPLEVVQALYKSGKISRVIAFNTLPNSQDLPADKIEVRSIAPLIVDNLRV